METVFDYNPTEEELKALFGSLERAEKARQSSTSAPKKEPSPNVVHLLMGRKQWEKARQYADNFPDDIKYGALLPDIDKAKAAEEYGVPLD